MKIVYKNDNLDPIGERHVDSSELVIDEILYLMGVSAEIVLDQKTPHLDSIDIIGLLDSDTSEREVDPWHLSINVEFPEILIASMWFPFNLLCDWIERDKQQLASMLNVEFADARGVASLPKGTGMFEWINIEDPLLILSKPLVREFTYSELTQLCMNIETWADSRINEVMRLAKNVKSAPAPEYKYNRKSIFICHSSKDKHFARQLSKALKEHSIDVWLDEEKILVGEDFIKQLERGIRESDFVVIVLTPNFIKHGPWAQEEFRMALSRQVTEQKTRILPVLKRECDIPDILRTKHYADFRKNFEIGLNSLLRSISRLVS